jgi:exopolyphosphatase/guanosine-5'-triphosphate,3'-diphosphate pyrophosphatase
VGGTRQGVKCLHAHYAWYLAGGDDPVGRWVAERLAATLAVDIGDEIVTRNGGAGLALATTMSELLDALGDADPPTPQSLSNAIGAVTDDIDNLLRQRPDVAERRLLELTGDEAWHLAVVERGRDPNGPVARLTVARDDLEDLFRTIATERRGDRLHNPGLQAQRVDTIVATCCAVLAFMRRLRFDATTFVHPAMRSAH